MAKIVTKGNRYIYNSLFDQPHPTGLKRGDVVTVDREARIDETERQGFYVVKSLDGQSHFTMACCLRDIAVR